MSMELVFREPEASELNFGNLNRVQVNFIEMRRQCERISEIGGSMELSLNALVSAVQALNALLDGGVDISGLQNTKAAIGRELLIITNGMKMQIQLYSKLNEEMTQEVVNALNKLFSQLYDQNGNYNPNVKYINEEGTLTKISYNQALNNAWANQGPMYPDFSNLDAWKNNNVYAQIGNYGQCTWFAAGRFYEIYGYEPGFKNHGWECVGQLLNAHPDKFYASNTPVSGAVFSTVPYFDENGNPKSYGHVGIILDVNGDMITYQDGNYDDVTNTFEEAQSDWQTHTVTFEEFKNRMGQSVHFANPNIPIKFEDNSPITL